MADPVEHESSTTPEPMPTWLDKDVYFAAVEKFTQSVLEKYRTFFEAKFPDEDKAVTELAARGFSRIIYLILFLDRFEDLLDVRYTTKIKDIRVEAFTEPQVLLDGQEVEHITNVTDEQLAELKLKGMLIFINLLAIIQQSKNALAVNSPEMFYRHCEKLAVEEMAHCTYIEWASHTPDRWTDLMKDLKQLNSRTDVTGDEYIQESDFSLYEESPLEKHGDKWVDSFDRTYYLTPPPQS